MPGLGIWTSFGGGLFSQPLGQFRNKRPLPFHPESRCWTPASSQAVQRAWLWPPAQPGECRPRRWPRSLATVRMNKSSTEIQGLLSDSSGGQPSPDVLQSSGGRRGCGVRGRQLVLRSPLGQGEPVPKEGASCVRPAAREWLRDHREKYENFLGCRGNRTGIEGCRKKTHCGRV